ncbi:MAG: hypothetical protein LBQ93_09725 [Treponema sp.]|nr:hypothetical protein [Treponema sp.]
MLFVLAVIILSVFFLVERNATKTTRQQESFAQSLRDYDAQLNEITGTERDYALLNRELDRIEKKAISVESWLSVLKRRRALARIHPPSMENYRKSVNSAAKAYPMSQPVAAIAAAALVKDTAVNTETEETLRGLLPLFYDTALNSLCLSLHVILGDFRNSERAQVIPYSVFSDGTESITINFAIMKILRGDIPSASADIQTILHSPSPAVDSLRFAAEFYYDFGDLERSAEIFSYIGDRKARIREADALYLAGFNDSARSIWYMLANDNMPNGRSLYNLGVTAKENDEAAAWFKRLVDIENITNAYGLPSPADRQFGLIRYSRMLDLPQAVAALENTEGLNPHLYPFIDLELCRRQSQGRELGRQFAEAWLLLDRHYENEDLYQWVSWLFLYQRNYSELRILLNRIENLQFVEQPWAKINKAIQMMLDGDLEAAQEILRSIPAEDTQIQGVQWLIYANLGRIIEAQRSHGRALEQYELAVSKTENPQTKARILLRIARCFFVLNRPIEARRALEYVLDIDPDNLSARLELDRLSS